MVIVFESGLRSFNWINQTRGNSGTAISGRIADCARCTCRTIRPIEKEITFFNRPTVVTTYNNAINLFDVILANIGVNQLASQPIERIAIRIAHAVGIDLMYLPRILERIGRRNTVLPIAADRIRTAAVSVGSSGSNRRNLPKGVVR